MQSFLPVCSTSSRPQARWTFPQGVGDSGLLTLPAWQKVLGERGKEENSVTCTRQCSATTSICISTHQLKGVCPLEANSVTVKNVSHHQIKLIEMQHAVTVIFLHSPILDSRTFHSCGNTCSVLGTDELSLTHREAGDRWSMPVLESIDAAIAIKFQKWTVNKQGLPQDCDGCRSHKPVQGS